jgi:hypothetical protein
MRNLLGWLALALVGCPSTGPTPTPPVPDSGDGGVYVACCASMGDTAPECPRVLQHVVESKLATNTTACSKCGLACP